MKSFDREEIKQAAEFLVDMGYYLKEDNYSVHYSLNNVRFSIVYPPDSAESDVYVRFIDKNLTFSVGWISLVRDGIPGKTDKLDNVKELLKYVKEKYCCLVDDSFCVASDQLIERYIQKNSQKFEKAVSSFLKDNKRL